MGNIQKELRMIRNSFCILPITYRHFCRPTAASRRPIAKRPIGL